MIELSVEELHLYRKQLYEALDTLCDSMIFRNSPKSCQFIRHVVHLSLEDRANELKERLIGMSLLGKNASYDTSTDSGVRVRANDVRRRLMKYNETDGSSQTFSIVLAAGTYVPRFLRAVESAPEEFLVLPPQEVLPVASSEYQPLLLPEPPQRALSFLELAAPTLVAIFLCIICMRWQLSQEQYFTNFWQEILHGDQTLLCLTSSQTEGGQGLVAIQELDEATPLLDLAGQFHHRFSVVDPGSLAAQRHIDLHVGLNASEDLRLNMKLPQRYSLVNIGGGRVIVDQKDPSRPLSQHAALLTIINGLERSIYIDGTDDGAIRALIARLCDANTFPGGLSDSLHRGTMIQAVFPVEGHAKPIFNREPLANNIAKLDYLP